MAQPPPPPLAQLVATFQAAVPSLQAVLPAFQTIQPQNFPAGFQGIVGACHAVINAFQNIIPGILTIQTELVELRYRVEMSPARQENAQAGLYGDFIPIGAAPNHPPLPPCNFPLNMRDLLDLPVPRANALIASWGLVVQGLPLIANKRLAIARHIGVRIAE